MSQDSNGFGACPTVRVIRDGVVVVINEADFDEAVHELYVEDKTAEPKTVDKMTKGELVIFAKEFEIEISGGDKATTLAEITAALEPVDLAE